MKKTAGGSVQLFEGNTLKAMKIMDALSAVDEELLERCRMDDRRPAFVSGPKTRRKALWQHAETWAAVMCMALLGAAAYGGYHFIDNIRYGASDSGSGMDGAAPQQFYEEADEGAEEAMDLESALTDIQDLQGSQTEGEGSGEEAGGAEPVRQDVFGSSGGEAGAGNTDGLQNGADSVMESGGGSEPGGDKAAAAADAPDCGDNNENTSQKEGESREEGTLTDESCRALAVEKYTLEQAAALENLGGYVPGKLPANYHFESAWRNLDVEEPNLTVSWSRGMDYLMLNIQEINVAPGTVDIGKPETYDVRLYEIPYAETVPQEYRQIFDNPVFAWEDMSLAIVESRMKAYADAGDADTPRGNFSVLFPDGILVRFNGRGEAEQIWEMFSSMNVAE